MARSDESLKPVGLTWPLPEALRQRLLAGYYREAIDDDRAECAPPPPWLLPPHKQKPSIV